MSPERGRPSPEAKKKIKKNQLNNSKNVNKEFSVLTNRKRVFFAFPLVRAENAGGSLAHLIFYYLVDAVQKYGNTYEKTSRKEGDAANKFMH